LSPWYAEGLRFECLGCGRCCRGEPGAIWITPEENLRIPQYLSLDASEWRNRLTWKWVFVSIRERANGSCVFYDEETARCGIYPVRPAQCDLFPFWPSIMKCRENWDENARTCPGMNQGRLHTREEIETLLSRSPFPFL